MLLLRNQISIMYQKKTVHAKYAIVCAGLHADKMAMKAGCNQYPKVVPFRGDYLVLKPEKSNMVRGNIYPVNIHLLKL